MLKYTVNKSILNALENVIKLVKRESTVVLNFHKNKQDKIIANVQYFDGINTQITEHFAIKTNETESCTIYVNGKDLYTALRHLLNRDDVVELEVGDKLVLQAKNTKMELPICDECKLLEIKEEIARAKVELTTSEFLRSLEQCAYAIGTTNPIMDGMYFDASAEQFTILTTDGMRGAKSIVPATIKLVTPGENADKTEEMRIKELSFFAPKSISTLLSLCKAERTILIIFQNYILINNGTMFLQMNLIQENFPAAALEQVDKARIDESLINIDVNDLNSAIDICTFGGENKIKMSCKDKKVILSSHNDTNTVVLDATATEDFESIFVSGPFLKQSISSMTYKKVTISVNGYAKPLFFEATEHGNSKAFIFGIK